MRGTSPARRSDLCRPASSAPRTPVRRTEAGVSHCCRETSGGPPRRVRNTLTAGYARLDLQLRWRRPRPLVVRRSPRCLRPPPRSLELPACHQPPRRRPPRTPLARRSATRGPRRGRLRRLPERRRGQRHGSRVPRRLRRRAAQGPRLPRGVADRAAPRVRLQHGVYGRTRTRRRSPAAPPANACRKGRAWCRTAPSPRPSPSGSAASTARLHRHDRTRPPRLPEGPPGAPPRYTSRIRRDDCARSPSPCIG